MDSYDALLVDLAGRDKKPIVFLDYDGTLTPIVRRPEEARLSPEMVSTLKTVATLCKVAIVSGRDLQDIVQLVGIDTLYYAGSHGFAMCGPNGFKMEHPAALRYIPDLKDAKNALQKSLKGIEGAWVEEKKFAIAIHYRLVPDTLVEQVQEIAKQVKQNYPQLRTTYGKKITEFRPDIDWDKGKAVLWLLDQLQGEKGIYIGDDETDEDAFYAIKNRGVGILVSEVPRKSEARFRLENPTAVTHFLQRLTDILK